MSRVLFAACLLASPLFAATAARAQEILGGSLIDALTAVDKPELSGVFTYVGEKNAPTAFADMIARDSKAMKRYIRKLKKDLNAAGGLTAWDHQVCATLVNSYAGVPIPGVERPSAKTLKKFNECVLANVVELSEVTSKRGK